MNNDLAHIAEGLRPLAVPLADLKIDPQNAMTHPDRNLETILKSLKRWGQRAPLIVRKETMVVEAGNGRLQAMRQLGWTHGAAIMVDDSEVEARQFSLVDNQSGLLAVWDYEQLSKTLDDLSGDIDPDEMMGLGFSEDELEVLLAADWTPPAVDPDAEHSRGDGAKGVHSVSFELAADDYEDFKRLIDQAKEALGLKGTADVVMNLLRGTE